MNDEHKNNDEDYTLVWRTPSTQKREDEVMVNIANIVNENEMKRKSFNRRQYKKKEIQRKRRRKDHAVGAVAGALATLMLIGGIKLGINLKEKYDFHSDLKKAKAELCEELTTKLTNEGLDIDTLKIEKHIKYPASRFTFTLFQYDNMFAPISLGENFFGCIEIFKEHPFSTDDAAYFRTIIQQVSLPLKSAKLYKEIIEKN